jgi:2-keto-4-pentenoate hydratase/2-oxohepta-3-ene-1,7-dioic acid hydratase in catechol pathway
MEGSMHWLRFNQRGRLGFGRVEGDSIAVCHGAMFENATPSGELLRLDEVELEPPCVPAKFFALWNNFRAAASRNSWPVPEAPLYFLKAANSFCAHGRVIAIPKSDVGRVLYEGELGVVIGKPGKDIPIERASEHIFGYTCVNDMTAYELLKADDSFAQWTRAKSFDSFTPFGPVIATGLDLASATVRTLINGKERQNYPVSDMIFSPEQLVSLLSRDVTLLPGDVIACGTSFGAAPLKRGTKIDIIIDGIGTLSNQYGESPG